MEIFSKRLRFVLLVAVASLQSSCASSPPETVPISRTGSGDATADGPCTPAGQAALVSAGATQFGVDKLCGYKKALPGSEHVLKSKDSDAKPLMQLIDGSGSETFAGEVSKCDSTRSVSYSGLLLPSGDIAAIVDVMRMQSFFPTDFKNKNFEYDKMAEYSTVSQPTDGFSATSYTLKKVGTNGKPDINYQGRLKIIRFSDGSYATVDKLETKKSGTMDQYFGVVFFYAVESGTAVAGRSEQTLKCQNNSHKFIAENVQADMKAALVRDFNNYSRAQEARQFMDGKRSSNGSN